MSTTVAANVVAVDVVADIDSTEEHAEVAREVENPSPPPSGSCLARRGCYWSDAHRSTFINYDRRSRTFDNTSGRKTVCDIQDLQYSSVRENGGLGTVPETEVVETRTQWSPIISRGSALAGQEEQGIWQTEMLSIWSEVNATAWGCNRIL